MLNVHMRVTMPDGTHDVAAGPLELVMFEREYGQPVSVLVAGDLRLEWLCFLAFRAMRRANRFDGSFDDFLAQVVMVEGATPDATQAAPFPEAQSTG